jgi:hypothetical protein
MRLLRVIRKRAEDQGSDFDLRGLGESPILADSHPVSVLVVSGIPAEQHENFWQLAAEHALVAHHHSGKNTLIVHAEKFVPSQHKTQALRLFFYFLKASEGFPPGSHAVLFEVNRLAANARDAIEGKSRSLHEMVLDQVARWHNTTTFLAVSPHTVSHLNQAGFSLSLHPTDSTLLNHDEVLALRAEAEAHAHPGTAPARKAAKA